MKLLIKEVKFEGAAMLQDTAEYYKKELHKKDIEIELLKETHNI